MMSRIFFKSALALTLTTLTFAGQFAVAKGRNTPATAKTTETASQPAVVSSEIFIQGMNCGGCTKQMDKILCQDKEASTWFESCKSEIVDAEKQIGKVVYTLKKDTTLDETKKKKIDSIVVGSGRKIIEYK